MLRVEVKKNVSGLGLYAVGVFVFLYLPIVTMAGSFMRARHGMAILTRMGVTATIVETVDDYVACAVRLARDVAWRMTVKAEIATGKARIYGDRACISALERFLDHVGRGLAPE